MSAKAKVITAEIIAALFILLFTYTAISKLSGLHTFKTTLKTSPWISNYAGLISIVLPAIELFVALLLFVPISRLYGLYGSFILMGLFTGYIALMIQFAPHLPCSCGGVIKQLSWNQHLIFNIFFLVLSIGGIVLSTPNKIFIAINPASAGATAGRGRRSRKPV